VRVDELSAIVERTKLAALSADEYAKLEAAIDTLAFVTVELQTKQTSLDRLRRLLFGAKTEKTRTLVGPGAASGAPEPGASPRAAASPPRPGHGRIVAVNAHVGVRHGETVDGPADMDEVVQPLLRSGRHAAKKARKTILGQSCIRRRPAEVARCHARSSGVVR
jgi:transposase